MIKEELKSEILKKQSLYLWFIIHIYHRSYKFVRLKVTILDKIGALTIAILIAILYRHFKGYPEAYRSGIVFSSKRLLKLAIILYGLKLNIYDVIGKGSDLLLIDIGVILFSIGLMLLLNKYIKGDKSLILLLGIGTGVCGAAAIAAVSPILKSREKDSAISIGIVALIGTIFSLAYTVIYSVLQYLLKYLGSGQVQVYMKLHM